MSFEDMAESAANPKNLPVEFTFDESLVRTVIKDNQAWFVAKDVCEILDINDPSMAVSRLDDDERGTTSIGTTAGPRELLTVNEFGPLWAHLHEPEAGSQALPEMGHGRGSSLHPPDWSVLRLLSQRSRSSRCLGEAARRPNLRRHHEGLRRRLSPGRPDPPERLSRPQPPRALPRRHGPRLVLARPA